MKKIIAGAAGLIINTVALAQLTTTLVVSATPPGTLIDWSNKKEILTYLVVNQSGAVGRAIIKTELKTAAGTLVASTNLATAKIYTIAGGTTILSAADVLPLQTMIFIGKYKTTLERTGKLLADNYQLCVQLVTPGNFVPVSELKCRNFIIASFQLPIPMMPANDAELNADIAKTAITFRWTPVAPRPTQPVTYRILVFEVFENQKPMQALRSNQPLLAKDIVGTTQFIWQPQLSFISKRKILTDSLNKYGSNVQPLRFIWTIQTFDQQGSPFGDGNINGDGISEPATFRISASGNNPGKEKTSGIKQTMQTQVKWVAPESMKTMINTSHSNIKNLLVSIDDLEKMLNEDNVSDKTAINTSHSNIKNLRTITADLEQTMDNLETMKKNSAMKELNNKMEAMNMQFLALQESLNAAGNQYSAISNVLKTKHDTVKNSINNIR